MSATSEISRSEDLGQPNIEPEAAVATTLEVRPARERTLLASAAPRAAIALLVAFLIGILINGALGIFFEVGGLWNLVFCLLCMTGLITLHLGYAARPDVLKTPQRTALVLLIQVVLVLTPILTFGPRWHGFAGLFVGSMLLLLPALAAWPVVVTFIATIGYLKWLDGSLLATRPHAVAHVMLATMLTGLVVYGLTRLVHLVNELHEARDELSRRAVAEERLRFSRDLHDVLGLSLSAVTLKTELASRLIIEHPERAKRELDNMQATTRQALADVRKVATGHPELFPENIEHHDNGLHVRKATGNATKLNFDSTPKMAHLILVTLVVALGINLFLGLVVNMPHLWEALIGVGLYVLLAALQLGYVSRPSVKKTPIRTTLVLLAQAILFVVPVLYFSSSWISVSGLVTGSILVLLPVGLAIPLISLVLVSIATYEFLNGIYNSVPWYSAIFPLVGTLVGTIIFFGISRLVKLVEELHAVRTELGRLAVAEERLRFSRDVHDLLGLNLSAISLKIQLAGRLLSSERKKARKELEDILTLSRRALTDARMVAGGQRELSLDEEYRSVSSVLSAADIEVKINQFDRDINEQVGTVLAIVLREGATNVLRHSDAEWCEISVRKTDDVVHLSIINDGVTAEKLARTSNTGNGIRHLSHRVTQLGGTLSTTNEPGDKYRLEVDVPIKFNYRN